MIECKGTLRINSPNVFGVRPQAPFLFKVAANAENEKTSYSAKGMPNGLTIDHLTGVISGTISDSSEEKRTVVIKVE